MLKLSGPLASVPALCLAKMSPAQLERLTVCLPKTIRDWELWIDYVQLQGAETLIYENIQRHHLAVPRWVNLILEKENHRVRARNRLGGEAFNKFLALFRQKQIPMLLCGSFGFAQDIYQDLDYKDRTTLHLLFRAEDRTRVLELYSELGFASLAQINPAIPHQNLVFQNWPLYYNQDLSLLLKTHWTDSHAIGYGRAKLQDLWNRSEVFLLNGFEIRRLSREDWLRQQCIRLTPHKSKILELAEIINCLAAWENFNWKRFLALASDQQSMDRVYRTLAACQSLIYLQAVQVFLESQRSKVSRQTQELVDWYGEAPEGTLLAPTNLLSPLEKTFRLFTLTNSPFEKTYLCVQLWRKFLMPDLREIAPLLRQETPLSALNKIALRLRAPFVVLEASIQELGAKTFLLMGLSLHSSLLRSWLRLLTHFENVSLAQKSQDLGLNIKQIKTIATANDF